QRLGVGDRCLAQNDQASIAGDWGDAAVVIVEEHNLRIEFAEDAAGTTKLRIKGFVCYCCHRPILLIGYWTRWLVSSPGKSAHQPFLMASIYQLICIYN